MSEARRRRRRSTRKGNSEDGRAPQHLEHEKWKDRVPSGDVHKTGTSRDGKEDEEDDVSSIPSGSAMSSSARLVCIHVHVRIQCTLRKSLLHAVVEKYSWYQYYSGKLVIVTQW